MNEFEASQRAAYHPSTGYYWKSSANAGRVENRSVIQYFRNLSRNDRELSSSELIVFLFINFPSHR